MSDATNFGKQAADGLWANIRAKKQRGGQAAKPGDKDYPDAKNWKKVTAISAEKSAANALGALGAMAGRAFKGFTGAANSAANSAAKPAAKAVGNTTNMPKVTISPADVAGTGRQMPAPAMPPTAPKVKITNADLAPKPAAAATAAPIRVSPAEAAAGRAKVTITPEEVAALPMKSGAVNFGRKVANRVDFYERAPKDETKKKLPDHEIFNNSLMRAEAAGEKPSAELFNSIDSEYKEKAKKEAKSKCFPCDSGMYKNHDRGVYQTGPMQAMDADEAISKTNGGVEATEETEHAEKDIHNSGQKSAYAFGGKVAYDLENLTGNVAPASSQPMRSNLLDQMPAKVSPYASEYAPGQAPSRMPSVSPQKLDLVPEKLTLLASLLNAGRSAASSAGNAISSGASAVNNARLSAGKAIGEGAYAAGTHARELFTGPDKPGMPPFPRQPAPPASPPPALISPALRLARAAAPSLFGPETETGSPSTITSRLANGLEKIMDLEQQAKAKQPRRPFDDNYKPAPQPPARKPAPAPASAPAPAPTSAKSFGQQAYDMLGTAGNAISSGASAVNNARLSAGKAIGEGAYAASTLGPELFTGPDKPGMTPFPRGTKPAAPKADAPKADAPKADAPGAASGLAGLPWGAIGGAGLGAAGLSALAYHLMSKKKKKKQDGSDEEG